MSKNMTRKGLVFGSVFALSVTGLGAPAQAAGLDDKSFVSLTPQTGTEYTVLTDQYFDLKSNIASTITSGGALKFLVEDTDSDILFDADNDTGTNADTVLPNPATITIPVGNETFELTNSGDDLEITYTPTSDAPVIATGELVTLDGFDATEGFGGSDVDLTALNDSFPVKTGTNSGVIIIDVSSASLAALAAGPSDGPVTIVREGFDLQNISVTSNVATVETEGTNTFAVGDIVEISGLASTYEDLNGKFEVKTVSTNEFTFDVTTANIANTAATAEAIAKEVQLGDTLDERTTILALNDVNNTNIMDTVTVPTTVGVWPNITAEGRKSSTDGSFVIDTNVNTATNDKVIRLVTASTDTVSVDVTAWVDSNDNGSIDPTEYTSETRTVTFQDPEDLEFGYSFTPYTGDETLELTFTTTPVLNGQQVDAQDGNKVFGALFTRQDSSDVDNFASDGNSTWDDTDKEWTASVSMDISTQAWTGLNSPSAGAITETSSGIDDEIVTITFGGNHYLRPGDKITISGATSTEVSTTNNATLLNATHTIATVPTATTVTFALPGADDDAAFVSGELTAAIDTYSGNDAIVDRVFPGTHTARPYYGTTKLGATQVATVGTAVSASTTLTVPGSTSVQAGEFEAVANGNNIQVKKGTTSVSLSAVIEDADGDAVGAGKPVTVALGTPNESGGKTGTFTINGLDKTSVDLTTDADGAVSFTVEENDGDKDAQVRVTVTPEGQDQSNASVDLIWNEASYVLYDLNNNSGSYKEERTVQENGSYTFRLALLDQWKGAAPSDDYRLKVVAATNTVSSTFQSLSNGRVDLTVADEQQSSSDVIDVDVVVQKDVSGTWTDQTSLSWTSGGAENDIKINVVDTATKVLLDTDGSTIYGSATADLADNTAAKATAAQNRLEGYGVQPAYDGGTGDANTVMVTGRIVGATTNTPLVGGVVTLSGPSNILFSENTGSVDEFGSTSVITGTNGEFAVELFSNIAQKDTEITVTPQDGGAASTVKVTFNPAAADEGAEWSTTAPAFAAPGSTYEVVATLTDKYGNPVEVKTADNTVDVGVTYTGPGIVFGNLPTTTDKNGQMRFAVLLGANDSGTATVTVSYDGDNTSTTNTNVATASNTVTVGTAPVTQKVNAGSFKGYVAVYALGYEGQRLSAKIGNDWVIVDPIVNNQSANLARVTDFTGAGYDIAVRIYIDRVLTATIPLTTK